MPPTEFELMQQQMSAALGNVGTGGDPRLLTQTPREFDPRQPISQPPIGDDDQPSEFDSNQIAQLNMQLAQERARSSQLAAEQSRKDAELAQLRQASEQTASRLDALQEALQAQQHQPAQIEPDPALVAALGEDAARAIAAQDNAVQARMGESVASQVQSHIAKAMKAAGLDDGPIDQKIEQRLADRDSTSWQDRLFREVPGFSTYGGTHEFITYSENTRDGFYTIRQNIADAIANKNDRSIEYLKTVFENYETQVLGRRRTAPGEGEPNVTRHRQPGPRDTRGSREMTNQESSDEKRKARLRSAPGFS